MNCPICNVLLERHSVHDANLCARALDERINHVRSKAAEQISGWEAAARLLRRRIMRDLEQSFT